MRYPGLIWRIATRSEHGPPPTDPTPARRHRTEPVHAAFLLRHGALFWTVGIGAARSRPSCRGCLRAWLCRDLYRHLAPERRPLPPALIGRQPSEIVGIFTLAG